MNIRAHFLALQLEFRLHYALHANRHLLQLRQLSRMARRLFFAQNLRALTQFLIAVLLGNLDQAIDGSQSLGMFLKLMIKLLMPRLGEFGSHLSALNRRPIPPRSPAQIAHRGISIDPLQFARIKLLHPLLALGLSLGALGTHLIAFKLAILLILEFLLFEITFAPGILLGDRKSTRLNSSHVRISYAVFC